MSYELVVRCGHGHTTQVPILRASVNDDGTIDGYCGSAADFCDTCDSPVVETLGVVAL